MQRISKLKFMKLLVQSLVSYTVRSICVNYYHFSLHLYKYGTYLYSIFYIYLLVYICHLCLSPFPTLEELLPDKDQSPTSNTGEQKALYSPILPGQACNVCLTN